MKKSVLVISEIFGLFFNTMTADEKDSRRCMPNFPQEIETELSQKGKSFSRIFIAFLKSTSNLKIFLKKVSLLRSVFPKLFIPKEMVT